MRLRGGLRKAIGSLAAATLAACAPPPRAATTATTGLGADPLRRVRIEPMMGARVVPIDASDAKSLGVEPGGGTRSILAGVRVVSLLGGAIVAADDRLPGGKWEIIALPERLGGGFLFKIDDKAIWRAEKWLGPARPIYAAPAPIGRVALGLDRVYVLAGAWRAIDGVTGEAKPLGPWPASPTVSAYAAADGWRALAIADLRGAVATSDAGATWRTLALPVEPRDLSVRGESLEVRGPEGGRADATYEVRADGQTVRVSDSAAPAGPATDPANIEPIGPLGARALVAAVDDGWPLDDGTALVARDGVLSRVRLEDGAVVEAAPGAFPLRPSRCHPLPLGAPGAIGFVCGEPHGATALYSFDAARGKMTEVRRFDAPRAVLGSGNGNVAVRGPCDGRATGDVDPDAHHYCIRTHTDAWREIRIEGAIGGERIAVLGDGRFVVVSPPQRGRGAGSVTVVEGEHARSTPIAFPALSADLARVLGVGVWLDGLEERRPGVLGGWVEAAGTMLGYELSVDGQARFGELVRGEGLLPMVSGRYGLGWSVARGGFETTDGGMNWTAVPVPEPIKPLREVASRACGPVGCSAAGWLRIGWGKPAPVELLPPRGGRPSSPHATPSLALECDAGGLAPRGVAVGNGDDPLGNPPPAAIAKDARLVTYDARETFEHAPRSGPVARVYAWGPKSGEWDHAGRWMVRWAWPFAAASDVRSSAVAAVPPLVLDAVRTSGVVNILPSLLVSLAVGDDSAHALLVTRRSARAEQTIFELEADHAPVEIKRADGEPLSEVEATVRTSGRWYLATTPPASRVAHLEEIIWQVEGGVARELARIPRVAGPDGRMSPGRLATRGDGRALGFVVDGQPAAEHAGPTRWVAAIDLDSGAVGDVQSLGPFYLGDDRAISLCASDDPGWTIDLPLDGASSFPISLGSQAGPIGSLHGAFGRVHIARSGAPSVCLERLSGSLRSAPDAVAPRGPAPIASINVTAGDGDGKGRRVFRCGVR